MQTISKKTIKEILDIKKRLAMNGLSEKNIIYMPEPIHKIAYGIEKPVIFYEVAGIKVAEIVGTDDE